MFLNNSKQLTRCMKVLQNTIIRRVTIFTNRSPSSRLKLCSPYCCPDYATRAPTTFAKNVLAGKRLDAYIIPSADFCASHVDYLDTYTVNLESDYNFMVFYNLRYIYIYIYIFTFYRSWSSCNWATYSKVIFYTLVYFSFNWIVSVIRSHDKYQSLILIGLALTGKASSGIQYILFHFRSYWRGWRPLVTPWACCIKEGIEPRISQKWFFPSHAQVSVSLSALLSFSSPVSAFIVLIVIIIITRDIYLQRVFIITVVMKTNLDLIIAVVIKTNLDILISKNSSLVLCFASHFCSLLFALSLSLLMVL